MGNIVPMKTNYIYSQKKRNLYNDRYQYYAYLCVYYREKRELLLYKEDLFDRTDCDVILDVNPQLEIFRCFGMSEGYYKKLKSKKTLDEVTKKMNAEFKEVKERRLFS